MRRYLLRWFAPLLIAAISSLPLTQAQAQNDSTRFNTSGGSSTTASDDTAAPVFAYFIAISSTVLILFTLLRPTRKQL